MYGRGKIFYSQFEGDVSDIVYPNILLSRAELFLRVPTFSRPYDLEIILIRLLYL